MTNTKNRLSQTASGVNLRPLLWVVLVFLATRIYLLTYFEPIASDTGYYTRTVWAADLSRIRDTNIYREFAEIALQMHHGNVPDPADLQLEYPPIAAWLLVFPSIFTGATLPPGATPEDFRNYATKLQENYPSAFHCVFALFDCCIFALLLGWLYGHRPKSESLWPLARRMLVYVIATFIFAHLIYDRLDLVLGLLIVVALLLLCSSLPTWPAFLALAIAINFKLVPIILIPLFAIGALRVDSLKGSLSQAFLRSLGPVLLGIGSIIGLVLAVFAPFFLVWGPSSWGFLAYHQMRGLQIESLWSTLIMAMGYFGYPSHYENRFGAWNIESGLSAGLASATTYIVGAVLILVLIALVLRLHGEGTRLLERSSADQRLAQAAPEIFVSATFVMLLVAMICSKVLSPQYLVWLLPLLALLPWPKKYYRAFVAAFLVMSVCTTLIFPYYYFTDVVFGRPAHSTQFGIKLLLLRNALLVILALVAVYVSFGDGVQRFLRGRTARAQHGNKT